MNKIFAIFGVVFVMSFVAASPADKDGVGNISVKVVTSDELKKLLRSSPHAEPLQRSVAQARRGPSKDAILYTVGQRIRGDRRVAFKEHTNSWSEPNDIQLELNYPDVGVGARISYIQVFVEQSNDLGQAYVLRGGIGQRFVTLILEAVNTNHFNYEAAIYGQE